MEGDILDDIDEEENPKWASQVSGRNCVLFLIDARDNMFKEIDGTSYFKQSITCFRDAMLDIARKQKGDLMGIILYGTKLSEGKYAPDNVTTLQELTEASVPVIKSFNKMIEDNFKEIRSKYGSVSDADLTRAINYCQVTMNLSKKKLFLKTIIMMTCDDNPCGNDEKSAFRARKQASELHYHHIDFDVVSFGEHFDSSKLFKELVLTSKGELLKDWADVEPVMKIQQLQNQIEKITQKFQRRVSFLRIGNENNLLLLQISLYKLFTQPKKFLTKTVKNEEVSVSVGTSNNVPSNNNLMNDDDDLFLQPDVMATIEKDEQSAINSQKELNSKCSTANETNTVKENDNQQQIAENKNENIEVLPLIGERFINITKAELKKRMHPKWLKLNRGFNLIGFVKTVEVPLFYSIGEPYFVETYGNDKNNRMAFSHFFHKCDERGVSMVGWFCLTNASTPHLCFLHPLKASTDGKGHPDGFLLVKVPFSDDLFEVDEKELTISHQPKDEQLEAARKIVAKMNIPYKVEMFNDAEYDFRLDMIEALAMEYDDVSRTEDNTDIDLEDIAEMLGTLSSQFCGGEDFDENAKEFKKAGTKRTTTSEVYGNPKQRKISEAIEMIQKGQADKLTVAELKNILKAEGIKSLSSMTKARLVTIATSRFSTS